MAYPKDILATRSVIKNRKYAVIPKDGLVNNVIPYFEKCRTSILATPKIGASFIEYVVTAEPQGCTNEDFGTGKDVESFIFVIEGTLDVHVGDDQYQLKDGGYLYSKPGEGFGFVNNTDQEVKFLLYKQTFEAYKDLEPERVVGNVNEMEYEIYADMENVFIKDLLPTDIRFDMNMHILAFDPGGCHPFVETHVQEHGAYVLGGEGVYLLDNDWMPIKKDDFIWFGPYVTQAAYGVGREKFYYIYSKDCNRDPKL